VPTFTLLVEYPYAGCNCTVFCSAECHIAERHGAILANEAVFVHPACQLRKSVYELECRSQWWKNKREEEEEIILWKLFFDMLTTLGWETLTFLLETV
jgi:hypothetical protein